VHGSGYLELLPCIFKPCIPCTSIHGNKEIPGLKSRKQQNGDADDVANREFR
jgi:hypothetical protein